MYPDCGQKRTQVRTALHTLLPFFILQPHGIPSSECCSWPRCLPRSHDPVLVFPILCCPLPSPTLGLCFRSLRTCLEKQISKLQTLISLLVCGWPGCGACLMSVSILLADISATTALRPSDPEYSKTCISSLGCKCLGSPLSHKWS